MRVGISPFMRVLLVATTLDVVEALAARGQVPKTPAQVPAFTGAVWRVTDSASAEEPSLQTQRYNVAAPVEAVVKFYVQRLGAKPETEEAELAPGPLTPGAVTPVSYGTISYDLTKPDTLRAGDEGEGPIVGIISATLKRTILTKARPPYEPDRWLSEAHFTWDARQSSGSISTFGLAVIDRGIPRDWKSWAARTEVALEVQTWPCAGPQKPDSPELAERCGQRRDEGAAARAPAPPGQPPRALLYPGATFDAQTSAALSSSGSAFFVYVTTDPAAKVRTFYEAKTGKKAQSVPDGSFAFFLSGHPLPDLTIQSNLAGPLAGKTVITIAQLSP